MRITDLLDIRSISLNAAPADKSQTLDAAVSLMTRSGKINDEEAYRKQVYAREEESTTGIGEGIAIPHGKCDAVKKPGLAAMVIKNGVEFEALGIVKGTVVQTKNVGKDFMAGMKTLVGGEITGYTEMLNEARQIATKRMVDEAKEMNADAVIGVKYGSSQVMSGAAEVIAYGTAVKYK